VGSVLSVARRRMPWGSGGGGGGGGSSRGDRGAKG